MPLLVSMEQFNHAGLLQIKFRQLLKFFGQQPEHTMAGSKNSAYSKYHALKVASFLCYRE